MNDFDEFPPFLDITAPTAVEVTVRADGKVLWVWVDGKTVLRCCRIGDLVVDDGRQAAV